MPNENSVILTQKFIIRLEAIGFSRILDSLWSAHSDGVHAFEYNSAENEPIWMKYGALRVHCLADFGCDPRSSESWSASRARFHRFSVGQISQNLNTTGRRSVSR